MKVVWERGSATVKDVCEVMSKRKPTAYTTILTLMGILEEKGALSHVRTGRAYLYKPLLTREQAVRNQIHDLITRLFDGKPEKLIESVLDTQFSGSEGVGTVQSILESRRS